MHGVRQPPGSLLLPLLKGSTLPAPPSQLALPRLLQRAGVLDFDLLSVPLLAMQPLPPLLQRQPQLEPT